MGPNRPTNHAHMLADIPALPSAEVFPTGYVLLAFMFIIFLTIVQAATPNFYDLMPSDMLLLNMPGFVFQVRVLDRDCRLCPCVFICVRPCPCVYLRPFASICVRDYPSRCHFSHSCPLLLVATLSIGPPPGPPGSPCCASHPGISPPPHQVCHLVLSLRFSKYEVAEYMYALLESKKSYVRYIRCVGWAAWTSTS